MEEGRRERDRLIAFERDVVRKKEDAKKAGTGLTKEGLLKDIAKVCVCGALRPVRDRRVADFGRSLSFQASEIGESGGGGP